MKIAVASGKGGTGKTSLTAAFAHLAADHVICDLDVDAPDMHLLLHPENVTTAMVCRQTITEYRSNGIAGKVRQIWAAITTHIELPQPAETGNALEINPILQNQRERSRFA